VEGDGGGSHSASLRPLVDAVLLVLTVETQNVKHINIVVLNGADFSHSLAGGIKVDGSPHVDLLLLAHSSELSGESLWASTWLRDLCQSGHDAESEDNQDTHDDEQGQTSPTAR